MNNLSTIVEQGGLKWTLKCGNILDEPADVLVCSANGSLNLSGGVGADLLGRYGMKMQSELHKIIASRTPRAAKRGEVIQYSDVALPYNAILHAVAVDGWYQTTAAIVEATIRKALTMAGSLGARKVALTALATGFGNLSLANFAEAVQPLLDAQFPPIEEVCICLMEDYRIDELASYLKRSRVEVNGIPNKQ